MTRPPFLEALDDTDFKVVIDTCTELEELFKQFNSRICRNCPRKDSSDYQQGCCTTCASSCAHYGNLTCKKGTYRIDYNTTTGKLYTSLKKQYGFVSVYGFFEQGKGCRLPRYLRSSTCLRYCCIENIENQAAPIVEKLDIVRRKHNMLM